MVICFINKLSQLHWVLEEPNKNWEICWAQKPYKRKIYLKPCFQLLKKTQSGNIEKKPSKFILVIKKEKGYQQYGLLLFTMLKTWTRSFIGIVSKWKNSQQVKKKKQYQQLDILFFTMLRTLNSSLFWKSFLTRSQLCIRSLPNATKCMT